jgi:EmrB/QacA subfamily drug resistance transporter
VNRKAGVLAAVYVAVLAINLDVTIVNVALPSIASQLHADTRGLQWVVDGYNLTFAALVLAAGSLSDRYGRRPALLIGLLGFAVTSALGALATSTGALVAARFSMGVFAALIFPTTLSIITNTFSDRRQRAIALGGWGAVVGVGVAAGPVTGGLLLEHFSWGSVFWALVPLALLAAVLTFFLVPESRDPGVPALDILGLTTSIALLGVLVYTIIEAPARGWRSTPTVFGFVATAALALAFVTIEQAAEHPMLDVRLFTDRRFSAASASVMVTFFSLSGFIFLITQYFQVLRGFSPLATGARILPVALSIAVGSVVGGLLAPRIGTRAAVVSGLASFGTAMAWIAGSIDTDTPYWTTIVAQMLLMGLGIGLISTPATESIMLVLPPARAGIGSAVNDATRELGSTLGVAIVGSLFSSVFGAHLADSAFAATGKSGASAGSVQIAFGIAANNPQLLAAAQNSFLAGLRGQPDGRPRSSRAVDRLPYSQTARRPNRSPTSSFTNNRRRLSRTKSWHGGPLGPDCSSAATADAFNGKPQYGNHC